MGNKSMAHVNKDNFDNKHVQYTFMYVYYVKEKFCPYG